MPNLASTLFEGTPEAVILASMHHGETAKAIFSTPTDFDKFIENKDEDSQMQLRLDRLAGRLILQENKLVPIGMGTERLVLGSFATKEVVKYAYKSTNPEADLEVEEFDYNACKKYFGATALTSSLRVGKLQDQQVLTSRQPWNDLVPLEKVVGNPKIDRQAYEIGIIAEEGLAEEFKPLALDGSSLMVVRHSGEIVITDTSLVYLDSILDKDERIEPPRPQRSWTSLGLSSKTELQKAA